MFAVLDLTSGYHQAPIDEASVKLLTENQKTYPNFQSEDYFWFFVLTLILRIESLYELGASTLR